MTGDEMSASDRWGPGGTLTKWLPEPSFPFKVLTNVVSNSLFCKRKKFHNTRNVPTVASLNEF